MADALELRQLLPGLGLGSVVQNAGSALTGDSIGGGIVGGLTSGLGAVTSGLGGITSDIGSGVSSVVSPILPTVTLTTDTTTSTTSTNTISSTTSTNTTTSTTSTTSSSALSSTSPLPDNNVQTTVTSVVSVAGTATGTPAPPPKSFLQNKPLAGFVFGLVGLVVLIILFTVTTFALRRRRRRLLTEEAVSFEPTETHYDYPEKGRISMGSNASHGTYNQHPASVPANPVYYPSAQEYEQQCYAQAYSGIAPSYYPSPGNPSTQQHAPSPGPLPDTLGSDSSSDERQRALKIANE